jgi:hypothetical protein
MSKNFIIKIKELERTCAEQEYEIAELKRTSEETMQKIDVILNYFDIFSLLERYLKDDYNKNKK